MPERGALRWPPRSVGSVGPPYVRIVSSSAREIWRMSSTSLV